MVNSLFGVKMLISVLVVCLSSVSLLTIVSYGGISSMYIKKCSTLKFLTEKIKNSKVLAFSI